MKLLLDLGNTRLKWGTQVAAETVVGIDAHAWSDDLGETLAGAWSTLPKPDGVWAASVVDAAREAQVAAAVEAQWALPVHWVRTPARGCGVEVAYAQPDTMGVDRFLGLVAARAEGHAPCILASAGTALVLDALAKDGRHLGGLIAPGAWLMQTSVLGAAARVRPAAPGQLVDAGASTADGLVSGCWQACAALVDRFATRMAARLDGTPTLLLGGGDAETLIPLLEHAAVACPNAVLRGLAVWAAAEA
ncbi:MAG TPA: type III pantothenate kinase [Rhodanobacteraceae bacterium]